MSRRVLILSASVGSGHLTAARVLERAFAAAPQVAAVLHRDGLETANPVYRLANADAFMALAKRSSPLLGWLYDYNDAPWRDETLRVIVDRLNLPEFTRLIVDFAPDIVVCTHFMPAGIVAQLLIERRIDAKLAVVTTDYDFQGMWLVRRFHRYFVSLAETRAHMAALGIPAEHITVAGIPVDPELGRPVDRAAVLASYDLQPDRPTLLYSAGAAGAGPARAIVTQLMLLEPQVQVIVVCGRNADLRQDIIQLVAPQSERFRVLGYTSDMTNLLRSATLFIGKPGGLTTAECMAAGLPMVTGAPVPGQEERNSDHLLEAGAAIRCHHVTVVAYKIAALLADPERLAQMRASARRFGRPEAATRIVTTMLNETQDPVDITPAERRRMYRVLRDPSGMARSTLRSSRPRLYDQRSGDLLGNLSRRQLRLLHEQLAEIHPGDQDFDITTETLDQLRRAGADSDLLAMLELALDENGEGAVFYSGPAQPPDRPREE